MTNMWARAAAGLACMSVFAMPHEACAQPVRAIVVNGELSARAERLAAQFGASELSTEENDGITLLRAPPEEAGALRAQLTRLLGRSNVALTRDDYRSILSPAGDVTLSRAQQARLALFGGESARVTVLRAAPAALVEHALQHGFGQRDGFAAGRAFRIDLGDRALELSGSGDGRSWRGAAGSGDLNVADGAIYGRITSETDATEIVPLGDGLHAAITRGWTDADNDEDADGGHGAQPTGGGGYSYPTMPNPVEGMSTIDVLVVYTALYTDADLRRRIAQQEIDRFNRAVAASFIFSRVQLRLVGVRRAHDAESTLGATLADGLHGPLDRLIERDDGALDDVHKWREQTRADIVVLIGRFNEASESCGLAPAVPDPRLAFAVIRAECISQYTFQHEVGHLFGLRHDWQTYVEQRPACQQQTTGNCWRATQHGHGFLIRNPTDPNLYVGRTMMAYGDHCGQCRRFLMFSNPGLSLVGIYGDDAPASAAACRQADCPLGTDARENEATALARWAPYLARHSDSLQ